MAVSKVQGTAAYYSDCRFIPKRQPQKAEVRLGKPFHISSFIGKIYYLREASPQEEPASLWYVCGHLMNNPSP